MKHYHAGLFCSYYGLMRSNCLYFLASILVFSCSVVSSAQTLLRGNGTEPDSIDPQLAQSIAAQNIARDLCTGLYVLAADGHAQPAYPLMRQDNKNHTEIDIHLGPEAVWSDGRRISAADYLRAFELITRADSVFSVQWKALKKVTAPQRYHLHFELLRPIPWLNTLLAHPMACPRPSMEHQTTTLSSGAYYLESWKVHDHIELRASGLFNVGYDVVKYFPVEDSFTELLQYRAGSLDITETIPPGRLQWAQQTMADALHVTPYLGSFFLGINVRFNPLQSRALRQALSLVIDRKILTHKILANGEKPAWTIVPPGIENYPVVKVPEALLPYSQLVQMAKDILTKAGIDVAELPVLELRYNTSPSHRRTMLAVSSMWKQSLGVRTQLVNEEWKVFAINRKNPALMQLFRGGWIADYNDPLSFLELFASTNPMNLYGFHSQKFDQLLMTQGAQRMPDLKRAEQMVLDQQIVIPLYYYVSRHLVRGDIAGWEDNVQDIHLSRWLSPLNKQPSQL